MHYDIPHIKMDKQKKELTRQIDTLIISCVIGNDCDEAELMRLASNYGNVYHSLYELSDANLRSLETKEERTMALRLEHKVNNFIFQQKRFYSEMGSRGSVFKTRKHKVKTPSPRAKTPSPRAKTRRSYCNVMGGTKRRRH